MLNSRGSNIDPCVTSVVMLSHSINVLFIPDVKVVIQFNKIIKLDFMVPHAKVCIGWCKQSAHCSTPKLL